MTLISEKSEVFYLYIFINVYDNEDIIMCKDFIAVVMAVEVLIILVMYENIFFFTRYSF